MIKTIGVGKGGLLLGIGMQKDRRKRGDQSGSRSNNRRNERYIGTARVSWGRHSRIQIEGQKKIQVFQPLENRGVSMMKNRNVE
jgi:hypothetical protein